MLESMQSNRTEERDTDEDESETVQDVEPEEDSKVDIESEGTYYTDSD